MFSMYLCSSVVKYINSLLKCKLIFYKHGLLYAYVSVGEINKNLCMY